MRTIRFWWVVVLIGLFGAPAGAWQSGQATGQVTRYDATDLPGSDLDDLVGRARSFDDCAQRCMADDRCGAFTFNLNSGNCIPKSSGGSPQRNARAVSGIVSRTAPPDYDRGNVRGVTRYDATDFPGNDLPDMTGGARSYEDCAQRCLGDGRCGQFTFNLNNGNCIPKASGSTLSERNEGAISGVVDRASVRPPPGRLPVTRYDATDFPQYDIDDMVGRARSYEDCARRCLGDGRCAAFTFNLNNGACIPKSGYGPPSRNSRAVSGVVDRGGADRERPPRPGYGGGGGVNACSVGGTARCSGCSASCGPNQRPVCNAPLQSPTGFCLREAECRCASN